MGRTAADSNHVMVCEPNRMPVFRPTVLREALDESSTASDIDPPFTS
jgi:hypothetical protein